MKVTGEGQGAVVSATRGPGGELTIYALNPTEKALSIAIAGSPPSTFLHQNGWNHRPRPALRSDQAGVCTIELPPMALSALTTFEVNLSDP